MNICNSGLVTLEQGTLNQLFQLDNGQTFQPSGTNITIGMLEEKNWKIWCNMNFTSYPMDKQVFLLNNIEYYLTRIA